MSNNMNTPPTIRWKLLSTVSALALLASTYTADAAGNDADRPTIWIELGGQMENIGGQGAPFAPAFLANNPDSPVFGATTPLQAQKPPKFAFGEEGKISFQPEDSDWVFSAGVRVGRSSDSRHVDHQTSGVHDQKYLNNVPQSSSTIERFVDTQAHHRESHAILDFSAGKDVGVGLFGKDGTSVLSAGVRFAQFASRETVDIRARPDLNFWIYPSAHASTRVVLPYFHTYHATGQASRSFRGVGPSLLWSASAPFAGNPQDGEITIDWGANAALLFGKQKAHTRHQETGYYVTPLAKAEGSASAYVMTYHNPAIPRDTERSVTVPNVGGSLGLSYRYQDAKISVGYRADFFFGAMDTGIDAVKKSNLTFNGPYASISVGLGD